MEKLSPEVVDQILQRADELKRARIQNDIAQRPFQVQRLVLDLTSARLETDPLIISFPFRSIFVQDATDNGVSVNFRPTTTDSIQSYFGLKKNDSWNVDTAISRGYLHWSAQSGKTITLIFFTDAEFKSGSQISVNSGGVAISEGSVADATTRVTLAATTAAAIAPANADRNVCLLENATGADLYVSGANTVTDSGATRGIKIASGDYFEWRNTAALYGYSVAGGDVHYLEQE